MVFSEANSSPPKSLITVVGCGALGQFYAAQLIHAGHEVRLLARRDAAKLAQRGLFLHQTPTPTIASTALFPILTISPQRFSLGTDALTWQGAAPADWLLVALKATAIDSAQALVAPLIGPNTGIVVMCNGLGLEDRFADWFGAAHIFGMLCYVGVSRDDDGTVRHHAYGHVGVGHYLDEPQARLRLEQLCQSAGIECHANESLLEARWRKLTWNLTFNGLCLLFDCTTKDIVEVPERRDMARALATEVVDLGNRDLEAHGQPTRIEPTWAEAQLRLSDTMGAYAPSTLLDARAGRPIEWEPLFAEPARRAERLGAKVPTLQALLVGLKARGVGNG